MTAIIQLHAPLITFILSFVFFIRTGFDFNFSKKKINLIIFFWILIWTAEYWLLGPYSYIRYYDEADHGVSRMLYDIFHHLGGNYLHAVQGGKDFFALQLHGGQYISFERFLFTSKSI